MVPCVSVCLLKEHRPQWATCGMGTMDHVPPEYQGWKCVWILYDELEFSNSYFHLNICRRAAQSDFKSLLGIWHSPLWLLHHYIPLFCHYIIVSPDLQTLSCSLHAPENVIPPSTPFQSWQTFHCYNFVAARVVPAVFPVYAGCWWVAVQKQKFPSGKRGCWKPLCGLGITIWGCI